MIHIDSAGISDVGKKRQGNEDAFFLDDDMSLYLVADGMGGHLAGEVASNIVVNTISKSMPTYLTPGIIEQMTDMDETLSREANSLVASIRKANMLVYQQSQEDAECRGMGSTISGIYCTDSIVIAANVGDSPIYLIRNGEIELLSVTHTVEAEQTAIDPERAKMIDPKFHHMLTRAVGIEEDVNSDVCEMQCFKGDRIVLCSDGLSNFVPPQEIADIATNNTPESACRKFVDLANDRGGDDNITAIVLHINKVVIKKNLLINFFLKLLGR